jgi:hypothetical protein
MRLSTELNNRIIASLKAQGNELLHRNRTTGTLNVVDDPQVAFDHNMRAIKKCDIMVAEVSYHSNNIGYDIATAISDKKPIVMLFNMEEDLDNPAHITKVPTSIRGNLSSYIILREYKKHNVEATIKSAIDDAKELMDTKLNLIIPHDLNRFLEWSTKEMGISKSELTRQAIQELLERNERYQNYLKENGLL